MPLFKNGTCGVPACPSPSSFYDPDTQMCECSPGYASRTWSSSGCVQSHDLSQSDKIAIAVGLGVGLPLVLLTLWQAIAGSRECCPTPFHLLSTSMRNLCVTVSLGDVGAKTPSKGTGGSDGVPPVSNLGGAQKSPFSVFNFLSKGKITGHKPSFDTATDSKKSGANNV